VSRVGHSLWCDQYVHITCVDGNRGHNVCKHFAIRQTGTLVCPDNTTLDIRTYTTTTTDENGNRQPATAYVLQCLDTNGNVVKEDPVGYAFLWVGFFAAVGLVISSLLAFVLAAPAGVLISKLFNRMNKPNVAENIEPR